MLKERLCERSARGKPHAVKPDGLPRDARSDGVGGSWRSERDARD